MRGGSKKEVSYVCSCVAAYCRGWVRVRSGVLGGEGVPAWTATCKRTKRVTEFCPTTYIPTNYGVCMHMHMHMHTCLYRITTLTTDNDYWGAAGVLKLKRRKVKKRRGINVNYQTPPPFIYLEKKRELLYPVHVLLHPVRVLLYQVQ